MLSAPVIDYNESEGVIEIAWELAYPGIWNVEVSADGVSGWNRTDTVPHANRTFNFVSSGYYRIIGVDVEGDAETAYSNVLNLNF